jgi:ribonuclease HI
VICTRCVSERDRSPEKQVALDPLTVTERPSPNVKMPVVYTDGAYSRNPGRGGYAAVIVAPFSRQPLVVSGGETQTTNNRMEMRAVIEGLNALDSSPSVEVVTDSQYVLKGFTEWLPEWIRRGWRTSSKKPVKNADLWAEMATAVERHGRVTWRWTRGHSGDRFNEMADRIAEALASDG